MAQPANTFRDLPRTEQLSFARRGTAYFAQRLAELSDAELDQPSLLAGWSRRHLLAHVGYNAVALCRLMDWASSGVETPMYPSLQARTAEIDEGATLPPAALRNLFDHTVARLDEKWRRATESVWSAPVRTAQGREVAAVETIWLRAREVWIHAVDLDNGGRFGGAPPAVLDGILSDVLDMWRSNGVGGGLTLDVEGRGRMCSDPLVASTATVAGPLPAVVRWVAGRGAVGLSSVPDQPPPRWL